MSDEPDLPTDAPLRTFGRPSFGEKPVPTLGSGNDHPYTPQPPDDPAVSAKLTPYEHFTSRQRLTSFERNQLRAERKAKRVARQEAIRQRRLQAFDLHIAGASYHTIGKQLGVSHVTAMHDVDRVFKDREAEHAAPVERKRLKLYLRAERLTQANMLKAMAGDKFANEAVLGYMEQEAKLYGLYAPTKIASTTPDGESWAPLTATLQRLSTEELMVLDKIAEMRVLPQPVQKALPVIEATAEPVLVEPKSEPESDDSTR